MVIMVITIAAINICKIMSSVRRIIAYPIKIPTVPGKNKNIPRLSVSFFPIHSLIHPNLNLLLTTIYRSKWFFRSFFHKDKIYDM